METTSLLIKEKLAKDDEVIAIGGRLLKEIEYTELRGTSYKVKLKGRRELITLEQYITECGFL